MEQVAPIQRPYQWKWIQLWMFNGSTFAFFVFLFSLSVSLKLVENHREIGSIEAGEPRNHKALGRLLMFPKTSSSLNALKQPSKVVHLTCDIESMRVIQLFWSAVKRMYHIVQFPINWSLIDMSIDARFVKNPLLVKNETFHVNWISEWSNQIQWLGKSVRNEMMKQIEMKF